MKTSKAAFFLSMLMLLALQSAFVSAKPQSLNFINFQWDNDQRLWKPYNYYIRNNEGVIKFLPEGQKSDDWVEMVTTQWFENTNMRPTAYFQSFIKGMRDLFPTAKVSEIVFHKSNMSLMAEWWTESSDKSPPLYGLVKVFSFYPHVYLLTYTTRDPNKIAYAKHTWLPIMKKASLNYAMIEMEETE